MRGGLAARSDVTPLCPGWEPNRTQPTKVRSCQYLTIRHTILETGITEGLAAELPRRGSPAKSNENGRIITAPPRHCAAMPEMETK